MLQNALTVYDYLQRGISLYNMVITGQRLWLSEHGEEFRLNLESDVEIGVGAYQSHMESLITTIAKLREAAGPEWSPREVSLAYRACENIPDTDLLAGSRVIRGTGKTYLTIPRTMMGLPFPGGSDGIRPREQELLSEHRLPENLTGLVQLQIESMLSNQPLQIDIVAETLAMNTRNLQRSLAKQGMTYSQLFAETRMRQAAMWLENSDKPIAEIASDLGYWDASNFTRAFRRQAGVAPLAFRDNARRK
jgi:AraC-like DNA-binding protein